jgi:hypothetical protein
VRVIPNAIATPSGSAPWPPGGHLFAAGRLQHQKGFDVAIEALGRLTTHHPQLCLHLAGTGEEEHNLRRRARRLGIEPRVRFLGNLTRDEILQQIAAAAVVLVPSRTIEGFSLVALEAAHLGRPVVATRVGGLPETVDDGLTGLVVPPDDAGALAAAVGELLADPTRACDMCERARRRAMRFDVVSCACAYGDVYRSLGQDTLDSVAVQCAPGVVHERLGDEVLAIDLERGAYYGMTGTAADIWRSFEHSATLRGAARVLARRYRAPLDDVQADVTRFATRLQVVGLLVRAATIDGPRWPDGAEPVGRSWEAPVVETHEDMAHLLLPDPALLVDEAGWPHLPEPAR